MKSKCSLCNMELVHDELIDIRKKRHEDFHKDESIQTGGRQRNWTFGKVKWKEVKEGTCVDCGKEIGLTDVGGHYTGKCVNCR